MIHLIDGMGQLGEALKKILPKTDKEIYIYHKWDVWNKDDWEKQAACLAEFCQFTDWHIKEKTGAYIFFISTNTKKYNAYSLMKSVASENLDSSYIHSATIKLPMLIGRGPCEKFRNEDAEPFDIMDLISVEEAAEQIIKIILGDKISKMNYILGASVDAKLVKRLIQYGKNGI
jgi:predicted secreted acid phosphatase